MSSIYRCNTCGFEGDQFEFDEHECWPGKSAWSKAWFDANGINDVEAYRAAFEMEYERQKGQS